jgi:hypothetical protein
MKVTIVKAFVILFPLLAPADWVMENFIENPRMKASATIKFKDDKFRVDVDGGPRGSMSTILDTTDGDIIQLAHAKKEARKISGDAFKQRLDALRKKEPAAPGQTPPKATGEKEKIGDWECAIYTWSDDQASVKIWAATNIPKGAEVKAILEKLKSGGLTSQTGPDTSALPGVVVKSETTTSKGKSTNTITSIQEQKLEASEFAVPADYEVKAPPINPRAVPSAPSGAPGIEKKN